MASSMKIKICCPYCLEDTSQLKVAEDDSIDYCKTCEVITEGETVVKLMKGEMNEKFD